MTAQEPRVMQCEHDRHKPGQGRNNARIEIAAVEIMTVDEYRADPEAT